MSKRLKMSFSKLGYHKRAYTSLSWGKIFLFSFNHEVEAKEVLQKSSMVHHELPNVSCFDTDFEKAPFWIKVHQLPLENINVASATLLLKKVGEVLEVENPIVESKILRPYIRGRVKIDINKSLPAGCWVPRPCQAFFF